MNGEDLATLVNRLTSTWPTGVRGHVWTTELAMLDASPARRAYEQLVRNDDRPPSVARFLDVYRAVTTPLSGLPPPHDTGPATSLTEVISKLEWKVGTGTATETDVVDLERWRRHRARSVAPPTRPLTAANPAAGGEQAGTQPPRRRLHDPRRGG